MTGYNVAKDLIRCYDGEPWHGPNLRTILAGLDPSRAAAKPIAGAHSAWEILMHIDAWHQVILRRMDGEICNEPPADFPEPAAINEEAWQAAHLSFEHTLHKLADRIRPLTEEDMRKPVAGTEYHMDFMVRGAVDHLIYHSGQIAVLGKS
jgi:uncharacterized damage-inducible protein DinB